MKKLSRMQTWLSIVLLSCAIVPFVYHANAKTGEQRAVSLAGTTWSGTDSDGDHYVFTFEQDGTLAYKSPTGSYRNGKWNQFENAVYFEMNGHYSEYLGQIGGDIIQGKAWNKRQHKWLWKVTRNR